MEAKEKQKHTKCPVCEGKIGEKENFCPVCGWSIPEDVMNHSILFAGEQTGEYEKRLEIYRGVYSGIRGGKINSENTDEAVMIEENSWVPVSGLMFQSAKEMKVTAGSFITQFGVYDEYQEEIQQALLKRQIEEHNHGVGVCKNLSSVYTINEIIQHIQTGELANLYVGDYFDMDFQDAGTVRFVLAGFDCMGGKWKDQNGELAEHHAVIVPAAQLRKIHKRGESKDRFTLVECKEELQKYGEILQKAFGGHVLHSDYEPMVKLMNEDQLTGLICAEEQFPLFREYPTAKRAAAKYPLVGHWSYAHMDDSFWLAYEGPNAFSMISRSGGTEYVPKTEKHGIRPYFCVG